MEFIITLIFSFIVTWGIGLSIPILVRFLILKRPLSKGKTIMLVSCLLILNILVITAIKHVLEPEVNHRANGFAYLLIALASYKVLRINKNDSQRETHKNSPKKLRLDITSLLNKKNILGSVLLLTIASGLFYWYEIRPAKIRHDCSWVKQTSPAISGRPAMTVEELTREGKLQNCDLNQNNQNEWWVNRSISLCEAHNEALIKEYSVPVQAQPVKEWWEEARPEEYKLCLHSQGLKE